MITWRWSKLERPLLNHVPNLSIKKMISFAKKNFPDLAVDGDCSDMFAATFDSVKFGLRAANSRLFNIIQERLFEKKMHKDNGAEGKET